VLGGKKKKNSVGSVSVLGSAGAFVSHCVPTLSYRECLSAFLCFLFGCQNYLSSL
jgi:hypothetical protein